MAWLILGSNQLISWWECFFYWNQICILVLAKIKCVFQLALKIGMGGGGGGVYGFHTIHVGNYWVCVCMGTKLYMLEIIGEGGMCVWVPCYAGENN